MSDMRDVCVSLNSLFLQATGNPNVQVDRINLDRCTYKRLIEQLGDNLVPVGKGSSRHFTFRGRPVFLSPDGENSNEMEIVVVPK